MKALPVDYVNKPRLVNKISLTKVPLDLDKPDLAIRYLTGLQESVAVLLVREVDLVQQSDTAIHMNAIVIGKLQWTQSTLDLIKFNIFIGFFCVFRN